MNSPNCRIVGVRLFACESPRSVQELAVEVGRRDQWPVSSLIPSSHREQKSSAAQAAFSTWQLSSMHRVHSGLDRNGFGSNSLPAPASSAELAWFVEIDDLPAGGHRSDSEGKRTPDKVRWIVGCLVHRIWLRKSCGCASTRGWRTTQPLTRARARGRGATRSRLASNDRNSFSHSSREPSTRASGARGAINDSLEDSSWLYTHCESLRACPTSSSNLVSPVSPRPSRCRK